MIFSHIPGSIQYQRADGVYSFLSTGDLYRFANGQTLINGFIGSRKEGSANNIWLRIHENSSVRFYPLLGAASSSLLEQSDSCLKYSGAIDEISYEVIFTPSGGIWFWDITLTGSGKTVDLVYGQDLGMADMAAVLENELYAAQYLDHAVFEDECGYHVCSRQNLAQNGAYPYLQQGMLHSRAIAYSTDALQFFGGSYKALHTPAALSGDLESRTLQLESSYTALQSEKRFLSGSLSFTFYGCFKANHPSAVTSAEYGEEIKQAHTLLPESPRYFPLPPSRARREFGSPYTSPQWEEARIAAYYPERILEEREDGILLSFFTPDYSHIVLQQKELLSRRPHGNIITTQADTERVDNFLITSTNYIYGLFNGQTVVGNTSRNKLLSTPRGLMNLLKNSGQRLWVRINGSYRLLTLPSLFEAGMNYSRWLYQIGSDVLTVSAYAVSKETKIVLEVKSADGTAYDFIVTNQLVMGTHEFAQPISINQSGQFLTLCSESAAGTPYPGLHYDLHLPGKRYAWNDDRIFFEDGAPQNGTLLTISLSQESSFQLILQGFLDEAPLSDGAPADFDFEKQSYQDYYTRLLCEFELDKEGAFQEELLKLNALSRWYAHNAMVHFAVPHGLEQPGGAAWGTRDICQGPMEFFLATQKYSLARDILLRVFSHQSMLSGEWPQWFMFDRYTDHQEDCHGDVVFWPLKCIGDYLASCRDERLLCEPLPYLEPERAECASLLEHIKLAAASIEKRFLEGTHLISYAGGDWDDTLQPVNGEWKDRMVSSWTQALAYQTLSLLGGVLAGADSSFAAHLTALADNMKSDFLHYLIFDGIIAGFVFRADDGRFYPMLHPRDTDTGIHLRLLPMTRSILADIAGAGLAARNMEIIEKQLHFPDGVRLMDRPAGYDGGVSHFFRRAEQSANVGREISLQYVHAHIRYIESLCHIGSAEGAWHSLFEINPIGIRDTVPNAAFRQSNLYSSSSEGAFYDRYEYGRDFEKLRDGSIAVHGGWRIYSSGPGIYMKTLISDVLGIRPAQEELLIHPVLPRHMDGLRFRFRCFGTAYTFRYHISGSKSGKIRITQGNAPVPAQPAANAYGVAGVRIRRQALDGAAKEIDIWIDSL